MATDRPVALATSVRLLDIDDVEGFVCAAIERSGVRRHISTSEHLELIDEGICILYELAAKFEPRRDGYAEPGRFSGFAAQFLPRRLGDAWHRNHPEHVRVPGEDGRRRWHYCPAPLSLELYLSDHHDADAGVPHREVTIRPRTEWAPLAPSPDPAHRPDGGRASGGGAGGAGRGVRGSATVA